MYVHERVFCNLLVQALIALVGYSISILFLVLRHMIPQLCFSPKTMERDSDDVAVEGLQNGLTEKEKEKERERERVCVRERERG